MLTIILVVFLFCIAMPATISKSNSTELVLISHSPNNLQFFDDIGYGVTTQEIRGFIYSVYTAPIYYNSDIQRNMEYFKFYMNTNFGNKNQNYMFFIEQNSSKYSNYFLCSVNRSNYASFRNIHTDVNPSWTYLFSKIEINQLATYFYIGFISKGSGITSDLFTLIRSTIIQYQPNDRDCDCSQTTTIQNGLNQKDRQYWNVVCDDSNDINAYIPSTNKQWIYFQPQNCFYLLFVN